MATQMSAFPSHLSKLAVHRPTPKRIENAIDSCSSSRGLAYLVIRVALEDEDVHDWELRDVSMSLEFLPHSGPDRGDGVGNVIHGLYLRRLEERCVSTRCQPDSCRGDRSSRDRCSNLLL
jgi:hypothetical protein